MFENYGSFKNYIVLTFVYFYSTMHDVYYFRLNTLLRTHGTMEIHRYLQEPVVHYPVWVLDVFVWLTISAYTLLRKQF